MASLAELSVPIDDTENPDINALVHALDDWAVKRKFCFWTARRDKTRAVFVCPEEGCSWRYRGSPYNGLWVLVIENDEHHCISRGYRKHSSSSNMAWLDFVVSRHLNVTKEATPKVIVKLLHVRFAEELDYKRA